MSEAADMVAALFGSGGALTTIGLGLRWGYLKFEGRLKAIEAALEECRKNETESRERRATQLIVIELLWSKIQELDPHAAVLVRAKKLLDELKNKAGGSPGGDH